MLRNPGKVAATMEQFGLYAGKVNKLGIVVCCAIFLSGTTE